MPTEVNARLERAHYKLQCALYFTEAVHLEGATAFFAEGITEPEWNHATLLETSDAQETLALLRRIESLFLERGLPPALEVGPASRAPELSRLLVERGFEPRYRYAWLVADATPIDLATVDGPSAVEVRTVQSEADTEAYFEVFQATYPEGLDDGYARALKQLDSRSEHGDIVHHLARIGDRPVAVATSIHGSSGEARGVTGLYNLAVHPAWRRRGLGRLLTQRRVREARGLGHQVFLQTERASVERWQRRRGFHLAFTTEGWIRAA